MRQNIVSEKSQLSGFCNCFFACTLFTFTGFAMILGEPRPIWAEDLQQGDASKSEQVALWILELDAPSVDIRESAAAKLYSAGSQSLALLEKASAGTNTPEVRSRCIAIADAIKKDDLGRRVYDFLRDADVTKTHGLESWPSFAKIVGPGRLSKRLFKEVIEAHPVFAQEDLDDPVRLRTETERIGRDILIATRKGDVSKLGDAVTLMFASIRLGANIPGDVELTTSTLSRRAPFSQEIHSSALGIPLKALFREWMKTTRLEPLMIMITCMELGIEDGKKIAIKNLDDKHIGPDSFEISMSCMMRFGTREDIPWIEKWITDDRGLKPKYMMQTNIPMRQIPIPFGVPGTERVEDPAAVEPKFEEVQVQFRDVAFAVGLKILGEDVPRYYPRARWHPFRGYFADSLALPIDDSSKRDAILARWQELVKNQAPTNQTPGEEDGVTKLPPVEVR